MKILKIIRNILTPLVILVTVVGMVIGSFMFLPFPNNFMVLICILALTYVVPSLIEADRDLKKE